MMDDRYSREFYWAENVPEARVYLKLGRAYTDNSDEPVEAKFSFRGGGNIEIEVGDEFVRDTLDGEMEYELVALNGRVKAREKNTSFEQTWTFEEFSVILKREDYVRADFRR